MLPNARLRPANGDTPPSGADAVAGPPGRRVADVDLTRQDQSFSFRMREIGKLYRKWLAVPLSQFGVTIGQWTFLRALWEREGQSQSELSDLLGMTTAATVFSINLLERDGLAVRLADRKDRRRYMIYLTPKGKHLREELLPHAREIHERSLAGFTQTDIEQLTKLLERMKVNLNQALAHQASVHSSTTRKLPRTKRQAK